MAGGFALSGGGLILLGPFNDPEVDLEGIPGHQTGGLENLVLPLEGLHHLPGLQLLLGGGTGDKAAELDALQP